MSATPVRLGTPPVEGHPTLLLALPQRLRRAAPGDELRRRTADRRLQLRRRDLPPHGGCGQITDALTLVREDGTPVAEFLLHIEGDDPWFRWSDEPFDDAEA
ncbi:hypothetical protein [Spongiactinospora sp. TRM90649]|uniref:hypothetical protein n=1 Tax=Spongiactinospora sp. TRM90649 TaxID=3031114 RepID=UPI0023F6E58A|nr:hypothetical protein [Spongiactinospora sp. TRM90649]MDF5756303.1 hypothetical protein [Spongiactinospora sp. TRM90649]